MEVTETLDDVFYYISEYFYSIITDFRDFFFGFNALDYNAIAYIRFFFLTVPIIFAVFEALFDWILPTMFNLQPMGFRRFFIIRADSLKPYKAEVYKPIRVDSLKPFRSARFFSRYRKIELTPTEQRKFQLLYQQKYNCTATPMQLKRFVALEGKNYNYVSSFTGLSGDNKVSEAVKDTSLLGKGVSNSVNDYKEYREEKEAEERKKAV